MIAALLTELPGSSDILTGGFVSYANAAKQKMLGVSPSLLEAHGAVSSQVAQAMAEGALRSGLADISIAVTGIAGPGGGSAQKPVGTVYIAAASTAPHCRVQRHLFTGDRHAIREATTLAALKLATELLKDNHYRNSG
jgi:nicotinamide-nucleotide amidase